MCEEKYTLNATSCGRYKNHFVFRLMTIAYPNFCVTGIQLLLILHRFDPSVTGHYLIIIGYVTTLHHLR